MKQSDKKKLGAMKFPCRPGRYHRVFITFFCILFLGFWGCKQSEPEGNATVQYWSWTPDIGVIKLMVKQYMEENPNKKVESTYYTYGDYIIALKTEYASGDEVPDVVGMQVGSMLDNFKTFLSPLAPMAQEKMGANWKDRFFPIGLEQVQWAGDEFYALPETVQSAGYLWYNKTMLDKIGGTVPQTYEDLLALKEKLQPLNTPVIMQGAKDGWQNIDFFTMLVSQTQPNGMTQAQKGEIAWDAPGMVAAMRQWKKFFDDGIFQRGAVGASIYPDLASRFVQDQVAFAVALGSWHGGRTYGSTYNPDIEFSLMPLPDFTGDGQPSNFTNGVNVALAISKSSKIKDLAWDFLSYQVQGNGLQVYVDSYGDLPAAKGFAPKAFRREQHKQNYQFMLQALEKATQPRELADPAMREALEDALAKVATGLASPEVALQEVQAKFSN